MSFPITMAATLPMTSDAISLSEGSLQWHHSTSRFLIAGNTTRIEPHVVGVVGFVAPQHALKHAQQYSICGPFSHDPDTDNTIIRYSINTQTEVLMRGRTRLADETRPIVSGLGKVSSIIFAEGKNDAQPWNMILTVKHDYYDSMEHKFINFSIDYHFGYHTPLPAEWDKFSDVETMWLHGIIVAKNTFPSRYVIEVSAS